jgi:hypothetical protein
MRQLLQTKRGQRHPSLMILILRRTTTTLLLSLHPLMLRYGLLVARDLRHLPTMDRMLVKHSWEQNQGL